MPANTPPPSPLHPLGPYKDCGARLFPFSTPSTFISGVGDTCLLGSYERDGDWYQRQGKNLLGVMAPDRTRFDVSQLDLDCVPYGTTDRAVSWKHITAALAEREFLIAAFNALEQAAILETRVETPDNPLYQTRGGNAVKDKIFVLDALEAGQYFENDTARMAENTAYALENRATNSPEGTGWWWLRTLGIHENIAANVNTSGTIDAYGNYVYSIGGCARPVLWARQSGLHR